MDIGVKLEHGVKLRHGAAIQHRFLIPTKNHRKNQKDETKTNIRVGRYNSRPKKTIN